jgi:flagellar hook protein FlgE
MLRSLFSGVSGLNAHQEMMDVVGNNIANVNTTGFKSSSVVFQDLLSQIMAGASTPNGVQGGTNAAQVGLGVRVAGIETDFTQGALQVTGKSTDLAIQGDGFFVVSQNGKQEYTRAGDFEFDGGGNLVTADGGFVQGWMADPTTHQVTSTNPITKITIPPGQIIPPVQTTQVSIGDMLSSEANVGDTVNTAQTVYDTQGDAQDVKFTFTKTATNTWTCDSFDSTGTNIGTVSISFDPNTGEVQSTTPATWQIQPTTPAANWPNPITVSFGTTPNATDALKEFGGTSTAQVLSQNGSPAGTLQSFKVADDGTITGVFSNGNSEVVGQVAMASFSNPAGLEKAGNSEYLESTNSGLPQIGVPGSGGRGTLAAGNLEMSNVDLSNEFTNLIIAQRGFQANSKVITTSDQLLQTLLELKN